MRTQEEKLYANPLLNENAVDKAPGAGYHNPLQESRESRNEEAVLASCKCKKNDPNDMAPETPAEENAGSEVKAEMYANPLLDEDAVDKACLLYTSSWLWAAFTATCIKPSLALMTDNKS